MKRLSVEMFKFSLIISLGVALSASFCLSSNVPAKETEKVHELFDYLDEKVKPLWERSLEHPPQFTADNVREASREADGWPLALGEQLRREEPEVFLVGELATLTCLLEKYKILSPDDLITKVAELYGIYKPLLEEKQIMNQKSLYHPKSASGQFIMAAMGLEGAPEMSWAVARKAAKEYMKELRRLADPELKFMTVRSKADRFNYLYDYLFDQLEKHLVANWLENRLNPDLASIAKAYADSLRASGSTVVKGRLTYKMDQKA